MKAAFRFVGIVFVTLLVLLDFGIIPTFANERCLIGDADGDGLIMIVDCTLIQRDIELYPDWKNGDISYEEYIDLKQAIEERIQLIDKDIENIKQAQKNQKSLRATSENVLLNKLQLFDRLSRSLLVNAIDRILVFEDNNIIIKTKCNYDY